jgi:hypothetical protein
LFSIASKPKKITVDAFVNNESINHYTPLVSARELLPDWWKKMSGVTSAQAPNGIIYEGGTIKRCDSILKHLTSGFIIPLWSDLILETSERSEFRSIWSDGNNLPVVLQGTNQAGPVLEQHLHIKIHSPWFIQERTGVRWQFLQPDYHIVENMFDLRVAPGSLEFREQFSSHINTFMPVKNARIELARGTPIAHLVPHSDAEIEIKTHVLSQDEYDRIGSVTNYASTFLGRYKKNRTHKAWRLK